MCAELASGRGGAVASGHHLATDEGMAILREGGNAFDAAVCVALCLNVLEPFLVGAGGEAPILFRTPDGRVRVLAGQGPAPLGLTLERTRQLGLDKLPGEGPVAAVVPGALGAWMRLSEEFGRLPWPRLVEPAAARARGFPAYRRLVDQIARYRSRLLESYSATAALYMEGDRVPVIGESITNPALAMFYERLADAGSGGAARQMFYEGELGRELLAGAADGCLLAEADLAGWRPPIEATVSRSYRGTVVHKCGPWSQGPVFLQQLALLERTDGGRLGRMDADGLHALVECSKLAFADREAFYGDPAFVEVPIEALVSDDYAAARLALFDPASASMELRPGRPGGRRPAPEPFFPRAGARRALGESDEGGVTDGGTRAGPHAGWGPPRGDTTHLDVADRWGNVVAATPSGGWAQSSPLIESLGFCLSTRAQMFHLVPGHPNAPAPGKRPRTTLTPSIAVRPDGTVLAFGTPGGDCQDQWTLQVFLAMEDGGLDPQAACDAPLLHSAHFPNSFWPRQARPGVVVVEGQVPVGIVEELRVRGHRVEVGPPQSQGRCSVIERRPDGLLVAAISRRQGHPSADAF